MSNTVTNISYANTFGEWMVATNALINENNVLAAGDYTKSSGTIYLNETTQNSLQANGTVVIQKELRVQGTGSSATIDRNMSVGGQIYFTNSALGLTHTGQANLNGLVLVQGPGIGISVSNNAYVGGNTTIRYNTITNNVQSNVSVNTQTLSVTTNSYSDNLIANTQVQTSILSVSGQSYLTGDVYTYNDVNVGDSLIVRTGATVAGVNVIPFVTASFVKANAAYDSQNTTGTYANSAYSSQNTTGTYANSAFLKANAAYASQNTTGTYANSAYAQANSASLYANGAFIQANAAYGSQNTTGTYANSAFAAANSASLYANGAFIQANAAFIKANTPPAIANSAALYANGAFTQANAVFILANNILTGAQSVANLTVTGSTLTALSAAGAFKSLRTEEGLSVGGNFTINGTTVYNSPTLVLSSDTPNQIIYIGSFRTANGFNNGIPANAYIRYNETNDNWEINDVLNTDTATTYSRLLNANTISDDSTSTSTSTTPTSRLITGLYVQANAAFLNANSAYGSQNTTGTYANSAFAAANSASLYANGAFIQANAAFLVANTPTHVANSAALYANGAFLKANAAFLQANTPTSFANAASITATGAFIQANAAYGSQNTTGTYANSAFLQSNGAFTQSNAAFLKANAAYTQANTASNTFVGTTGTVLPSSGVISFSSNNGVTVVATTSNNFAVSTSQDLRTSASPSFDGLTLINALPITQGGTGKNNAGDALTALLPTGTTAGYVLTTGGPGNFYWSAGGAGGGGGATPGTTINSTRLSYTANGVSGYTGNSFVIPPAETSTQVRAYINGVRQFESEYTANLSSNTITFTTTPPSGDAILIEVDGYYVNPYYANNIAFTINSSISSTANTIQLAVDGLTTKLTTYYANLLGGSTFTGDIKGITMATGTSNTSFATTAHVQNSIGPAYTQANTATNNASTADSKAVSAGSYANSAFLKANAAFITANTPPAIANSAALYANAAFIQANAAFAYANTITNGNVQFYSIGVGTAASEVSGEIVATGTITAGYSDDNLKTKLGNIENALDKVMSLNGFYYEPNQTAQDLGYVLKREVGVSAQEVEKVLPEVVVPAPIDNKYLTIQYEKMVPLLIEAIKELKQELDALKGNKQ